MFIISRGPRQKSSTNVYHIIIRGINKQDIFLDKQDFKKFLEELKRTKEVYKYEIYAYVLMSNHIHFIVDDRNQNLSIMIQSLNVRYSNYFNKKYERVGHLFENRFKSKIIENESYLKNLIRYIHKNPENAGIEEDYIWSSYNEYLTNINKVADINFVMSLFENSVENFKYFHNVYDKEEDLGQNYEIVTNIEDEEAIRLMQQIFKEENLIKIQNLELENKRELIRKFLKIDGIKKIQVARILGINRKTIEKIGKEMNQKGQINQKETSLKEYGKGKNNFCL